ncbi:hypothetical protein MED193_15732 [Roseobacter sp. MED193]|nr:hypothetical protein MED193_15732 [Roseobacter sp. MED193]
MMSLIYTFIEAIGQGVIQKPFYHDTAE